ncbi:unnamed protein product [Caretta caretta]
MTLSWRIQDMAANVKDILMKCVNNSRYFALQLDEMTDIAAVANLLAYIRYEWEGKVLEDILFCRSVPRTTAEQLFQLLDEFVKEHGIDWQHCVGVCTDGARAMVGRHSGVMAYIRKVAHNATWVHCSIHQEALAAKKMPVEMKGVLDPAVKTVNFIKARPMNSRIFSVLCNEMGSAHVQLLLHTEVWWLSRGKVLTRLFELCSEIQLFLTDHSFQFTSCFEDFILALVIGLPLQYTHTSK